MTFVRHTLLPGQIQTNPFDGWPLWAYSLYIAFAVCLVIWTGLQYYSLMKYRCFWPSRHQDCPVCCKRNKTKDVERLVQQKDETDSNFHSGGSSNYEHIYPNDYPASSMSTSTDYITASSGIGEGRLSATHDDSIKIGSSAVDVNESTNEYISMSTRVLLLPSLKGSVNGSNIQVQDTKASNLARRRKESRIDY